MYGNDLSSRRRMLNGGRWRLTRFCSRWSASASVRVTMTSTSAIALGQLRRAEARIAALEVAANARAQRLRLAHVQDLAGLVAEEVDAGAARKRLKLPFKVFSHSRASVSPCVFRSWRPSAPSSRSQRPGLATARAGPRRGRRRGRRSRVDARRGRGADGLVAPRRASARCASRATGRPGLTRPSDDELRVLRNVGDAALRNGVRVYVTVMSPGSAHDAADRRGARGLRLVCRGDRARARRRSST